MAESHELEEKPLAPFTPPIISDKPQHPFAAEFASRRRNRHLKCCGCAAALLLIPLFTLIILMITVFHLRDPTLKLDSIKIDGLDLLSNGTNLNKGGLNLTLQADVTIKNPNAASCKFDEATTDVYYRGVVVGEAEEAGAGVVGPRRRGRRSVWVGVMVDKMVGVEGFERDFNGGRFEVRMSMRMSGVVKITDVVKKSVVVKMNCTMNLDLGSDSIQDLDCRRDVSF